MNPRAIELQKQIVIVIAGGIADAWERIVVNYEMADEDGGLTEDRTGFYIAADSSGELRDKDISFTDPVKEMFRALREEMRKTSGDAWSTCDLVIDPPGKFHYNFSYDPPKRINGVFDEESMGRFDHYLESYKAERARA